MPINGYDKPCKILSCTEQDILGQNRMSFGRGALNSIKVFSVGSEPAIFGSVFIFSRFVPKAGGTILFRLKTMKAF